MRKEGKKYIIRESELREIIQEALEYYDVDPEASKDMRTKYYDGSTLPSVGRTAGAIYDLIKNGFFPGYDANSKEFANRLNDYLKTFGIVGWLNSALTDGLGLTAGSNSDAHEVLDVQVACNYIWSHAHNSYSKETCGYCARAVKEALQAGGLRGMPYGMYALYAKNYLRILPANGWYKVSLKNALPGDVLVVAPSQKHPDGHMAMCVGRGADGRTTWCSDYKQKTWHGLGDGAPLAYSIFRYKNIKQ